MTDLVLYWNTVKLLRPIQVWGRIWHRLYKPAVSNLPAPPLREPGSTWKPCRREASMTGPATFLFLNHEAGVPQPEDWASEDLPILWRYNLHYFDDLNAANAIARVEWHRALICRWINENPPVSGNGWDPYPISLRVVNWIKWQLADNQLTDDAVKSLAVQVRYLRKRLEYHLLGNHLWANAKALVFAGCFFDGREADAWLKKGLSLLQRELDEQILDDGGHFERSPMYHCIILEDLLDLIQLSNCYPGVIPEQVVSAWHDRIPGMFHWLACMSHPDGHISFFNDAALGTAPDLQALLHYAEALGLRTRCNLNLNVPRLAELTATGYMRVEFPDASLFTDVGNIGPDYLPGHAHADTLSFELSLFGHRVVVNRGIDRYGLGTERLSQRGTAAHSTVEVDGENSSQVWSGFRVARRVRVFNVRAERTSDRLIIIRGSHDGYRWRPGRVVHSREWMLSAHSLTVRDKLDGEYDVALARYHLHPFVQVIHCDETNCQLITDIHIVNCRVSGGSLSVVDSDYHPEFGLTIPAKCLVVEIPNGSCEFTMQWSD